MDLNIDGFTGELRYQIADVGRAPLALPNPHGMVNVSTKNKCNGWRRRKAMPLSLGRIPFCLFRVSEYGTDLGMVRNVLSA
jgi:hypothetical protein